MRGRNLQKCVKLRCWLRFFRKNVVTSDAPNFCGDSLCGHARKTLLSVYFFSENISISDGDKKCDKIVLQVYPRNWRNRLTSKCPIFRTFCPKRVVGRLSRDSRDTSYTGPFGKRCFVVFFRWLWGCTVYSILNGFHTRISWMAAWKSCMSSVYLRDYSSIHTRISMQSLRFTTWENNL